MMFLRGGTIKMNKLFALMIISLFMAGSIGGVVSADKGVVRGGSDSISDVEQIRDVPGEMDILEDPSSLSNERLNTRLSERVSFWAKIKQGWGRVASKFTGNAVISQSEYLEGLDENDKLQIRNRYEESRERLKEYKQEYYGCLAANEKDCPLNAGEADVDTVSHQIQTVTHESLMVDVGDHVLSHIMLVMDKLQNAKEKLQLTTTDNSERIERIDSALRDLDTFAAMIKEASTEQELKDIIVKYKAWISKMKKDLLGYQAYVRTNRYGDFIENSRLIEEKTLRTINRLNSLPTVGVTDDLYDLHNKFSELIDSAEESYNQAVLNDESVENMDTVKEYLKESKEVLRDLLTAFKERSITVGEIKNA